MRLRALCRCWGWSLFAFLHITLRSRRSVLAAPGHSRTGPAGGAAGERRHRERRNKLRTWGLGSSGGGNGGGKDGQEPGKCCAPRSALPDYLKMMFGLEKSCFFRKMCALWGEKCSSSEVSSIWCLASIHGAQEHSSGQSIQCALY